VPDDLHDTTTDRTQAADASIVIPKRAKGRPSAAQNEVYEAEVDSFCHAISETISTLDFAVSSRGWCYVLEPHGLLKGDFETAQRLINDCRKSGRLPLDICATDDRRDADNLEEIDDTDPDEEVDNIIARARQAHLWYTPVSFWDDQEYYIEMMVEKIDLKSLFKPICSQFHIPIQNAAGWSDLHCRARIMERFKHWEAKGKKCVLLYCGDFDPGGLHISGFIRSNFEDMSEAVDWWPDDLIIDRFGLNYDFIQAQGLSWIENLETSTGKYPLNDPRHHDHSKSYVQEYLERYCRRRLDGTWTGRKVEANALVVRPDAGRELCRQAILKYLSPDAPAEYEARLDTVRAELRLLVHAGLGGAS
jgi:hypothetical protein